MQSDLRSGAEKHKAQECGGKNDGWDDEFCEQVNPRVLLEMRRARPFQEMRRVQESWVAEPEKKALLWLAEQHAAVLSGRKGGGVMAKSSDSMRMEIFLRWLRFNLVGGIGIAAQLGLLFLLKSFFHFNYLLRSAWRWRRRWCITSCGTSATRG